MNYREAFVSRAVELINSYRGNVPSEVKEIIKELGISKTPETLSREEFNLLQDVAEKIDTQIRINNVQAAMRGRRRGSMVLTTMRRKQR
mgnify:CR=1 FL=1